MKPSRLQMKFTDTRYGFTLVELLVVIIIIGILAGLLIPAIGSAMRRSKEFVVQKDVLDLKGALETFKNKYGIYPIDFSIDAAGDHGNYIPYQNLVSEFVDRLSSRHSYGNAGFTVFAPGMQLQNPYYGVITGSPPRRDPAHLDAAEGFVFFLGELSTNAEFPLGYVPTANANEWDLDPNGQPAAYYAFRDGSMSDVDQDGWPEFVPNSGPKTPVCYFDSRSYGALINSGAFGIQHVIYPALSGITPNPVVNEAGSCFPYLRGPLGSTVFEAPDGYQIISAGIDGEYGKPAVAAGLRYSKNEDGGLSSQHKDNIVSFREGRLGDSFERNN